MTAAWRTILFTGATLLSLPLISQCFVCECRVAVRSTVGRLPVLTAKTNADEIFDEYFAQQIAQDLQGKLDLPLPGPMLTYLVEQVVSRLSTDLSRDTKVQLQEIMEAAATPTANDDVNEADLHALADQIARDINPHVDMPVLDEDQEFVLLQQILRVVLASLTQSNKGNAAWLLENNFQFSRDLLGGEASRAKLVQSLDAAIQLPLPDESRWVLLRAAVDASAAVVQKLLPAALLQTLRSSTTPEGLVEMKEYLIDAVNDKVDLVGFDEAQEREFIETMVHLLLDEYVGDESSLLILTQEEQKERLEEQKAALEREKLFSERRFAREQANIEAQLVRVEARLQEIKRSYSFLRRTLNKVRPGKLLKVK